MEGNAEDHPTFQAGQAGWQTLFAAIDRRDARSFAAFFALDAEFRFGNATPVEGRTAIAGAVAAFFDMIAACEHRMTGSWEGPSSAVCEGRVTYTVAGGSTVTLPFVNVLTTDGGHISSYRIYIDNGPLFAALANAPTSHQSSHRPALTQP